MKFRCPFTNIIIKAKKPDYRPFPDKLSSYGDHLRQIRLERKLSQPEVAKMLNVDTESITNWELNHTKPQIQYIPRIISFLGYSPDVIQNPIIRYRTERGITQKELARILDIDPTTLARIEGGRGERMMQGIKIKIEKKLSCILI